METASKQASQQVAKEFHREWLMMRKSLVFFSMILKEGKKLFLCFNFPSCLQSGIQLFFHALKANNFLLLLLVLFTQNRPPTTDLLLLLLFHCSNRKAAF